MTDAEVVLLSLCVLWLITLAGFVAVFRAYAKLEQEYIGLQDKHIELLKKLIAKDDHD